MLHRRVAKQTLLCYLSKWCPWVTRSSDWRCGASAPSAPSRGLWCPRLTCPARQVAAMATGRVLSHAHEHSSAMHDGSLVCCQPLSRLLRAQGDSQSIDTTATSPAASLLAMTRTFGADAWRRVPPGSVLSFSTPDPRLVMATQSGSVGSRNRANKQGGSRRGRVDGGSGANSIRGGAASAGTSVDKKGKGLGARVGRAVTRTAAQVARGEGGATLTEGRVEGMWGFLQGASGAQGVW